MILRRVEPVVERDLGKKMVLLSGPRQCGKTTPARGLVDRLGGRYYNWDAPADRKALLAWQLLLSVP